MHYRLTDFAMFSSPRDAKASKHPQSLMYVHCVGAADVDVDPVFHTRRAQFFDADGNGEIERDEFRTALEQLADSAGRPGALTMTDEQLDGLIDHFDRDGDKLISVDEFQRFCYNIHDSSWRAEVERLIAKGELVGFEFDDELQPTVLPQQQQEKKAQQPPLPSSGRHGSDAHGEVELKDTTGPSLAS